MDAQRIAGRLARLVPQHCKEEPSARGSALSREQQQLDSFLNLFEATSMPPVSATDYAVRLLGLYERTEDGCVPEGALACILIERFVRRINTLDSSYHVSPFNVHRLFLTALLVATKYLDDAVATDDCALVRTIGVAGGVAPRELVQLEIALLAGLAFELTVTPDEWEKFCSE
eukprot:TRINITY_DN18399_c0_g1_i1.p1 TRINITY_DN18399_c0_g1~~TRINITY_DN18399_c0_g1_i1.p1  ORF type:complete len:173 (-),score=52.08 TRINITY_DN18399_c0_g1_i1:144-662(-)